MGFWRREVIEPALDDETARQMRDQMDWIAREPSNAQPYYHLALLYRMQWKQDEALGLLLEAVRLEPSLASAHLALAEIYVVRDDPAAAWRHARAAASHDDFRAEEMLRRHNVAEV
jgi:cytochrome c-type biogenesis protein CcmH/NrfG